MTSLVEAILAVDADFDRAQLGHAFGGALALGYVAEPRGTVDIDVNVFVPPEQFLRVVDALAPSGWTLESPEQIAVPAAGIRFVRTGDPVVVDVFVSLDDSYAEVEQRIVRVPFGPEKRMVPILSAEDLVVFKLSFGRDKDWVDLRSIAEARPGLDLEYVERRLLLLRGPRMHPRLARMRALVRAATERRGS
ncbi:MAG: nucleotidyltransferase family protein [Acidimicrobiales bacterium]|nr:nucleotidyltransferase family protein [Acidimicrobiales bacterium]